MKTATYTVDAIVPLSWASVEASLDGEEVVCGVDGQVGVRWADSSRQRNDLG